jgi:hypothetical protein
MEVSSQWIDILQQVLALAFPHYLHSPVSRSAGPGNASRRLYSRHTENRALSHQIPIKAILLSIFLVNYNNYGLAYGLLLIAN